MNLKQTCENFTTRLWKTESRDKHDKPVHYRIKPDCPCIECDKGCFDPFDCEDFLEWNIPGYVRKESEKDVSDD